MQFFLFFFFFVKDKRKTAITKEIKIKYVYGFENVVVINELKRSSLGSTDIEKAPYKPYDENDYEESKEICLHLPDTDNESNDSEILPRKRKRARRLISDDSERSDTSSEQWILKEIDDVSEIKKKYTGTPAVNSMVMQKLAANLKSLEVFEEVLNGKYYQQKLTGMRNKKYRKNSVKAIK